MEPLEPQTPMYLAGGEWKPIPTPVTRSLVYEELMSAYEKLVRMPRGFNDTSEPPNRHDDYLPLNLWDETPDE